MIAMLALVVAALPMVVVVVLIFAAAGCWRPALGNLASGCAGI
jgi:hypothetical protein